MSLICLRTFTFYCTLDRVVFGLTTIILIYSILVYTHKGDIKYCSYFPTMYEIVFYTMVTIFLIIRGCLLDGWGPVRWNLSLGLQWDKVVTEKETDEQQPLVWQMWSLLGKKIGKIQNLYSHRKNVKIVLIIKSTIYTNVKAFIKPNTL